MTLDYFYGQAGELFSFFRIPKALFQEQRFQNLSTDAKTLYGILLDRMSLSVKNEWFDKKGRVFIIFTIEDVKRTLCCADNKAMKLFRELEKFGLVERKRRGLGKPSLVYVKNFSSDLSNERVQNRENHESGAFKKECQDPPKSRCNKNKKNKTERNNTNPILSDESKMMKNRELLEEYFSHSLEIDLLLRLYPDDEDTIYQIVNLLVDTCDSKRKLIRIAGDDKPAEVVCSRLKKLNADHIHNADTEAKKAALFSKVRSGDVRVLLGSTAKMGAGTNVQQRLVAVHHLDVGWKPSDMTQRNGRIIRQGNMNKEVKVFNYVTEGTFDSYLFQTLENKQRFISQIMTSKSPVRSCDDVDEQALSYAEIKALCAGNPLIKEKMDLDVQVAKLKVLKADHQSQKFRLEDKLLTKFPADIQETNAYLAGVKLDAELATAHPQEKEGFCGITIKGVTYDEKKTAGERLLLACSELPNSEEKVIGSYRGFELSLRFDTYHSEYQALLKGQRKYPVALGKDPLGCIIRLDNSLNNFPERISSVENELATLKQQQAAAQIEVEKPFPQEEELAEKSARLAELNAQLDMDEKSHEPEQDEEPRRSSVLAALEEKSDKVEPIKPFKSYLDKDGDAR